MEEERDIEYELKVQRATQAAIWALPAVGMYDIVLSIQRDLGGEIYNDIASLSQPMTSQHGFLTANDVTPYLIAGFTTKDGALVVEVPPATDKVNMFGSFVNAWDTPIADIGRDGEDKGEGGKYLFLPADYEGDDPEGDYLVFRPDTNNINMAFRPVATPLGTTEDAVLHARKLKMYKLSEVNNPPETTFIDPTGTDWNTLPTYDLTYWTDIYGMIQGEVVLERDKAMYSMLADLGIEDGKPFNPSPETEKALLEGLSLAYDSMQNYFLNEALMPFWENAQWSSFDIPEGQSELGFPFVDDAKILIDERAGGYYFWATYLPAKLGGSTFYLLGLRDGEGNLLDGESTYKLNVPADTPAEDFWSVIVYSMKSKGFVYGSPRVGISDKIDGDELIYNDDGSVDIYFGPNPPTGYERNTIPTGEDFFLAFRWYGPGETLFDKSWRLNDLEKVN
jgi:hypothetical protein